MRLSLSWLWGPVGTLSWSGGWRTGYENDGPYGARLAESPPPYFPSTEHYHFTYWKEVTNQVSKGIAEV